MKVLIVGSGGRESAMVWAVSQRPDVEIFCAPGNAGIAEYATCYPSVKAADIDGLLKIAHEEQIDLTIVGPEAPLVAGIVDRFQAEDHLIFGPSKEVAQAEGSKSWFKNLLTKHSIPTAPYEVFTDRNAATKYILKRGVENIVIKADGLMGGKGVTLPDTIENVARDLERLMVPGGPGETVVIEDRLFGVERSVMALTDGKTVYMLPFTQDYKREGDGDTGLNTGGMGAHTLLLLEEEEKQLTDILHQVVSAFDREGYPYSGFLYLGIIMTKDGPMVLECNCRLGDPETQVILPSISGDFTSLCMYAALGDLAVMQSPWRVKHALYIVLASGTYPGSSERDDCIDGLDMPRSSDAIIFHAGTASKGDCITTNKAGRVLGVVGRGETLEAAHAIAYNCAGNVRFSGVKYRGDIGAGVVCLT